AAASCGKRVTGVSESALALLGAYDWPGNIRELGHVLERSVALAQHEVLAAEDLPDDIGAAPPENGGALPASHPADRPALAELKRRYIEQVLEESGGNVSRAAAVLGVDRRSLYRMLQRHGMPPRAGSREQPRPFATGGADRLAPRAGKGPVSGAFFTATRGTRLAPIPSP